MTGVRVFDAATFIAAPYTATILGEFGAEVIKVERPDGGDGKGKAAARTPGQIMRISVLIPLVP